MATYPAYDILLTSARDPESGIDDDFAQSGEQHSRIFHSQDYYRFSIDHKLSLAEWKTLKAFYDAGKRAAHTLTYLTESPEVTYTVKFIAPPAIVRNLGNNRFLVRCELRGTEV